jgi:predicted nucleic acid-binding protein
MTAHLTALFDSSVLIAASDARHENYEASWPLLAAATPESCACAAHALAEAYCILSVVRGGKRQRPEVALRLVEQIISKITVISLTAQEYIEAIRGAAAGRIAGGTIYDTLHIACARKVDAELIYTWNLRHFQLVAPDLAERIRTP